jgi:hypothetical protein
MFTPRNAAAQMPSNKVALTSIRFPTVISLNVYFRRDALLVAVEMLVRDACWNVAETWHRPAVGGTLDGRGDRREGTASWGQ